MQCSINKIYKIVFDNVKIILLYFSLDGQILYTYIGEYPLKLNLNN